MKNHSNHRDVLDGTMMAAVLKRWRSSRPNIVTLLEGGWEGQEQGKETGRGKGEKGDKGDGK